MTIISYNDLHSLKQRYPTKKIVFCSGSFDLTHAGHVRFLEACKNLGDILVVAVGKDKDIRKDKGPNRPIFTEQIRLKMVDSLKPVDYSFISNSPRPGTHWLYPIEEIFEYFKPDIWAVNFDGSQIENRKTISSKWDVTLVILELDRNGSSEHESLSTTSIIKKIRGKK